MSTAVLILGKSGTGKSASLRNMPPADTLLIQVVRKPLPFKAKGWAYFDKTKNSDGNIIVTDHWETILKAMRGTRRKVIVIDDFQYVLANEYMRRTDERGYDKFTDIGRHAWELITAASDLPPDVRVYILAHTDTNDAGETKMKTIGKMLDEKITPEGLFTIVLRTYVADGHYQFTTRNNGSDSVKSPMGLFDADRIPNDLAEIDSAIVDYYGITHAEAA
jgi:hypothetical protein